jgi:CARDB
MRIAVALAATAITLTLALGGSMVAFPSMAAPSPAPIAQFDTGTQTPINIGGSPADSNIAVSRTHICLTARGALACYTKSGRLVRLGPDPIFQARPYTAEDFFLTSSNYFLLPGNSIVVGPVKPGSTPTKDGRIVFDQLRKRFLVVFQTRDQHPQLLIAASRSEDPRDGWFVFGDSVEASAATAPFTSSSKWGQDYMWIGVNCCDLLISNQSATCSGTYYASWTCPFFHTRHLAYALDMLTTGQPINRKEWIRSDADGAVPCIDDSSSGHAFWVRREDNSHITVFGMAGSAGPLKKLGIHIKSSVTPLYGQELGGSPVDYPHIINNSPTNVECRSNRLVFVANDGHQWLGLNGPDTVVHLVSLNVKHFFDASPSVSIEHDLLFGRASQGDPPGFVADYGWPAVATNTDGDIVVGSVRSAASIYPQLRASVWFSGQPNISSSVKQIDGVGPLADYHMAGAAADPSTMAVYLSQAWGSGGGGWQVHAAKMLGVLMPDLLATQIRPQAQNVPSGGSTVVEVHVLNQGDGMMPPSTGLLKLSTSNVITMADGEVIAQMDMPALAPDQEWVEKIMVTMPKIKTITSYYIGAILDVKNVAAEYSEANNMNPEMAGNHGNAYLVVQ